MQAEMILLIVYLLIALLFSFICSILEAVILSVTPSFVSLKQEEGKKYAKLLRHYKENIDRPLAAILTLNTFAHTIGAAGVGAQAQLIWGNEYLSIISAVLTIIILIFSEIIPKTLGANYWQSLAGISVYAIRILMFVLYPFVVVSQMITRFLKREKGKSVLSRYEFHAMAEAGVREGIFRQGESKIIQNIARFDKIQTRDIMTPRTVLFAADKEMSIREFYDMHQDIRFSRIPVYNVSIDDIAGYVLKDELLSEIIEEHPETRLNELVRKLPVVYEGLPIPDLFNELMGENEHIALVVDEYGGTAGIVTMEDVIETILGMEIMDEFDNIADLQKAARESWKTRARKMGLDFKDEEGNAR